MKPLRLATRGSELAVVQSLWAGDAVARATGHASELVRVGTKGDREQSGALADLGSIGLFTTQVQEAVLDGRADYAVHSLKDLPTEQAPGLHRAAIPGREEHRDYLLVRPEALDRGRTGPLPVRAAGRVGTASARRAAFLDALAPDLRVELLRGNVPTRIERLRGGDYEAILLAGAGLSRLGLQPEDLEVMPLDPATWPGAPGQGALALECRDDDATTCALLAQTHDEQAAEAVLAERSLLQALGGGCGLPLGAHARRIAAGECRMTVALGARADGDPPLRRAEVAAERMDELADRALKMLEAAAT